MFKCFPCGSAGKESACNTGDLGSIPGLGRSPGEGKGYPPQYSDLENSMDFIVHGVAKSWTRLSNFHFSVCVMEIGLWRPLFFSHSPALILTEIDELFPLAVLPCGDFSVI